MLQRSLYRSLIRTAAQLQQAAGTVSLDPLDELRKFFTPALLGELAPRARGGPLVAAVRQQFALHRTYPAAAPETEELISAGFRALRQAGERIAQLQQPDWRPRHEQFPSVRYATGDCVQHRRYGYHGVIVGWDGYCMQTEEWKRAMRIEELEFGSGQPFYHVLVDTRDRTPPQTCYVAQENVRRIPDELGAEEEGQAVGRRTMPVQHPDIEEYMSSFVPAPEFYYVPSEWLRQQYPEDGPPVFSATVAGAGGEDHDTSVGA